MTWQDTLLKVAIIVGQSLALLVALLVFIAYILLADARSGRRCNCDAGQTWLAPSAAAILRGPSEVRAEEPVIPSGANKALSCWRRW